MSRRKKILKNLHKVYDLPSAFNMDLTQLAWAYDEMLTLRDTLQGDDIQKGSPRYKNILMSIDKLEKQRMAITRFLNIAAGYQAMRTRATSSDKYKKVAEENAEKAENYTAEHDPLKEVENEIATQSEAVNGGSELVGPA